MKWRWKEVVAKEGKKREKKWDGETRYINTSIVFNHTAKDCGPLSDPANGDVDLSEGTEFGASAMYSCDDGYILSGTSTRNCLDTGLWSGVEPTCDRKSLELQKGERIHHVGVLRDYN